MPPFLRNTGRGWVTAEYGMLPRSTHTSTDREAARGRQSGRTQDHREAAKAFVEKRAPILAGR